ncbi:MAG: triose-phosphate isomerase [Candidatus Nealsonbacteria bacterium CG_4_8_14_3_um_filter_39_7]|uniref:Triosephosphate isomerase n=1 Tax=Candidatus Nealsonbacteria bacterium CG23_combo_of_CG06-09_8_20_14_all_39_17 TaxID=1974722 RepID=A0A2G9YTV3_9BACT|nr:MAG: triose-phosphate isomerase [Candidatus Nealsonbacteria bacterium CG23_combo_of_CG06-09_8_20_14_all_39_17]PIU44197.1 MAG: triose-phosphate isomerase [Candidatus Nealsonbacteria bacterium CG07_land_8_20_14_0_80_39_13]PIW90987.1 MAG: triose-phosphate isomerase [Candidatus Nealsonbacteria bacterium CG_4_8_14_3_um_filter_39_7]
MKYLIVANWKMNPASLDEAKRIFNSVSSGLRKVSAKGRSRFSGKNAEVVICPPFIYLQAATEGGGGFAIGSQTCFSKDEGAFTGEISAKMLKNFGCEYVIIGHSERRVILKETDHIINKKIKGALKSGLKPILCIDKLSQVKKGIEGLSQGQSQKIILAFEPISAIGTGEPYDISDAKKMNNLFKKNFPKNILLYGGSVGSKNAKDYIEAGFNGLLVGGASLNPKEFIQIVNNLNI